MVSDTLLAPIFREASHPCCCLMQLISCRLLPGSQPNQRFEFKPSPPLGAGFHGDRRGCSLLPRSRWRRTLGGGPAGVPEHRGAGRPGVFGAGVAVLPQMLCSLTHCPPPPPPGAVRERGELRDSRMDAGFSLGSPGGVPGTSPCTS